MIAVAMMAWLAIAGAKPPAPQPTICVTPGSPIYRSICRDEEMRAWARAAEDLYEAYWKARPYEAYDSRISANWPGSLEACADLACAREAYADWVGEMDSSNIEPFRIPRSKRFRYRPDRENYKELRMLDLGDGWVWFSIQVGWSSIRGDGSDAKSGSGSGVVKLVSGRGRFVLRESGAELIREKGGWRVTQIGDCECGNLIHLDGLYR